MPDANVKKIVLEFLESELGSLKKGELFEEVMEHSGFSQTKLQDIFEEMIKDGLILEDDDGNVYVNNSLA